LLRILEARVELGKLTRDWHLWSKTIAEAAVKTLGECEVYVFGSVVEGHITGGSDVDMLIVAEELPGDFRLRTELKARIEEVAKLPLYHPFELHLASRGEVEANPIYREVLRKGLAVPTPRVEE